MPNTATNRCPLLNGFLAEFAKLKDQPRRRLPFFRRIRDRVTANYANPNTRATYFTQIRNALLEQGATQREIDKLVLSGSDYDWRDQKHDERVSRRQLTLFRARLHPRAFLDTALRALESDEPVARLLGVQALTGRRNIEIFARGSISPIDGLPGWALFAGQAKAAPGAQPFPIPILHPGGFEPLHSAWQLARRDLAEEGLTERGLQYASKKAVLDFFGPQFPNTHLLRSAAGAYSFYWLKPPMTPVQWLSTILGHRVEVSGALVPDRDTATEYDRWEIEPDGELPPPWPMPHLSLLLPHLIAPPVADTEMPKTPDKVPHVETSPPAPPVVAAQETSEIPKVATDAAAQSAPSGYSPVIAAMNARADALLAEAQKLRQQAEQLVLLDEQIQTLLQSFMPQLAPFAVTQAPAVTPVPTVAVPTVAPAPAAPVPAPAAAPAPTPATAALPTAVTTPAPFTASPASPSPASLAAKAPSETLSPKKRMGVSALLQQFLAAGTQPRSAVLDAIQSARKGAGIAQMQKTAFDMLLSRYSRAGVLSLTRRDGTSFVTWRGLSKTPTVAAERQPKAKAKTKARPNSKSSAHIDKPF